MPVCNKVSDVSDRYERGRDAASKHVHSKYGVTVPTDGRSYLEHGAHLTYEQLTRQFAKKPNADVITSFVSDEAHQASREQWLARNAGKFPLFPSNGSRIYVSTITCRDSIGTGIDRSRKRIPAIRHFIGVYRYYFNRWHEVVLYPRQTNQSEFNEGYLNRALVAINPHVARTETESRDILKLFLSNEEGRQKFKDEFTAMMNNKALSFSEKYDRFVGDLIHDGSKAQRALEKVWLLAFGEPWAERDGPVGNPRLQP